MTGFRKLCEVTKKSLPNAFSYIVRSMTGPSLRKLVFTNRENKEKLQFTKVSRTEICSQTCELRPPKGLGISGPISQVVSFAVWFKNFQNEVVHMPLCEPSTSAISSSHVYAGQRPCQAELPNAMIACSEWLQRKSWTVENYFSLNLTFVVAFPRLNQRFGPTSGVHNSYFSGGRIFKNAVHTFESANWREWFCVSAIFRWSVLSGGRKDRFDCRATLAKKSLQPRYSWG